MHACVCAIIKRKFALTKPSALQSTKLCFIYPGMSMYKQSWVNCTIHTELKHTSNLFKAQFSAKAGPCFLKVHAAPLIAHARLHKYNKEPPLKFRICPCTPPKVNVQTP